MVDGRSLGSFAVGGAFNFKSGDISGTAANMQDDKMGPGTEYGEIPGKQEEQQQNAPFVDRSAQLRATLNSLAMMNVADVLNNRKRAETLSAAVKPENKEDLDEEFLNDFDDLSDNQGREEDENNDDNSNDDVVSY